MRYFLKIPDHHFQDFFEKARFLLTWRSCFFFSLVLGVVTTLAFFSNTDFFPHYLFVWSIITAGLIFLYFSSWYKLVALMISLGGSIAVITSVAFVKHAPHVIEIVWMVVVILFSFFTLGRRWGIFFSCLTALLFSLYFYNAFFENVKDLSAMTPLLRQIMVVEFIFGTFLIVFIMLQFHEVNKYAEETSKLAFQALRDEKEIIKRQNEEMTVLLQEIHHRVKNNLQVIVSLLRIQAAELKSEEALNSFNEAVSRIMTMSLIHQKMYESESLSDISLKDYFDTLIKDIIASGSHHNEIQLTLNIEPVFMDTKTLVPLALIVNELVSNSLKHAFSDMGKITISTEKGKTGGLKLVYFDNGTWKEPDSNTSSLGLQLIEVFTEQLEGKFTQLVNAEGTSYVFDFKEINFLSNKNERRG